MRRLVLAFMMLLLVTLPVRADDDRIYRACEAGDLRALTPLVTNSTQANKPDDQPGRRTPLHYVVSGINNHNGPGQYAAVMRLLIQQGANVNTADSNGSTPLHLLAQDATYPALQTPALELARILVDAGADLSVRNKDGDTPLHLVCKGTDDGVPMLDYFISKRANLVDLPDRLGRPPLSVAVGQRRGLQLVQHLIRARSNIHFRDSKNYVPLHWACSGEGGLEVVQALMAAGAKTDVNAVGDLGYTPLLFACTYGWPRPSVDVVRLLVQNGADPTVKMSGQDAAEIAVQHGATDIATYLKSLPRH